ncbi:hypothetical protein MMC09_005932 [Bachmanniomyces sp. S44760]|nr:hypothetical protein [Bachmanniomyces sp. S44760]
MPPSSSASLYSVSSAKLPKKESLPTSTNLAFVSQLSSLLAAQGPQTRTSAAARPRPSKAPSKSDIFTAHNKNTKKRAAADISSNDKNDGGITQKHNSDIGGVDATVLHRSKRKMEEKARLYAAMKRGDYIPGAEGKDEQRSGLVDFDRKWAEKEATRQEAGKNKEDTSTDSDDGGDSDSEEEEMIEYEDEFGRTRKGTRTEALREQRRLKAQAHAAEELHALSARPKAPEKIIYGDTVQSSAFNPDEPIALQMESLAAKRDRTPTPPPETHYDASKEVRSKGVGFYQFSGDKEGREREMGALEAERVETERLRGQREEARERRKREVEERKRVIKERRVGMRAERFLEGLGGELDAGEG